MSNAHIPSLEPFIKIGGVTGKLQIDESTPLRRLNYFDGKFLRASDLQLEQRYQRALIELSNQAGGPGIVHGYSAELQGGDALALSGGLAIDAQGRVLLLPQDITLNIAQLIEASRQVIALRNKQLKKGVFGDCEFGRTADVIAPIKQKELYVISIAHAETLCGAEDVYGKICEQACSTDTARPYWVEGIVVRARPLSLESPFPKSAAVPLRVVPHLRSQVASAYFADEARRVPHYISGAGLLSGAWCEGAQSDDAMDVPIAVIARRRNVTLFLDPWIVRRERMETPPRRYWAWHMRMRPWDVFLAHVLQFQCQLARLFRTTPAPLAEIDPCQSERDLMRNAARSIQALNTQYLKLSDDQRAMLGAFRVDAMAAASPQVSAQLQEVLAFGPQFKKAIRKKRFRNTKRILIEGGIVELPSAGYLPVELGTDRTIEDQVQRLVGEGVDLRFCVVRTDFVAHALEEAQHMDRISLLQGIDNPANRQEVDILVPDGEIEWRERRQPLHGYELAMRSFEKPLIAGGDQYLPPVVPASIAPSTIDPLDVRNIDGPNVGTIDGSAGSTPASTEPSAEENAGSKRAFTLIDYRLGLVAGLFGQGTRMKGMGRGEILPDGSSAFFFAGTARDKDSQSVDRVIRAAHAYAEDREADPSARRSFSDRLGDAVRSADETVSKMAKKQAEGGSKREASLFEFNPQANLGVASLVGLVGMRQGDAGLWSCLRASRNAFRVPRNEDLRVEARFISGVAQANSRMAIELRLDGRFIVTRPTIALSNHLRQVGGDFDGRMTIELTREDGTTLEISSPIKKPVEVERYETDTHDALKLRLKYGALNLVALAVWPSLSAPADLDAEVYIGAEAANGAATVYMGGVQLRENPDVFREDNALHVAAASVIDFIGSLVTEQGFAEREKKNLFKPDATEPPLRIIHAKRDWVLFHRRRIKDCGERVVITEEPVKPVKPPRKYAVYLLRADNIDDAKGLVEAVVAGDVAAAMRRATLVGDAEFDSGGTQLTAPSRQDFPPLWTAAGPGAELQYGVMGTAASAADTTAFSKQRLEALVAALAPTSVPNVNTGLQTRNHTLAGFPATGRDGAIALITVQGTPVPPKVNVAVSPTALTIKVGETVPITATVTDQNGTVITNPSITYSSAASAVASVNSNGMVTGVSQGTTVITVTSSGQSASVTVTVV